MPNAANITVKKNDGTTDIVWTTIAPAGGDNSPALWRSETISGPMAVRPTFTMTARKNGTGTAKRMDLEVLYPQSYTDSTTGLVQKANTAGFKLSAIIPLGMDTTQLNEAVAQAMNLFASTLTKQCLQSGAAAS